jgi:hypothetical protein
LYTVAETHELGLAGFHLLDKLRNFLNRPDLQEHAKNFFIGTAVERPVECGDGRGGGGIRVHVRTANAPNRVGGAILFVIGVQDKENVQSMLEGRIGTVAIFRGAEEHVQEVAGIAELIVGVDERHTEGVAVGKGRDGGHLPNQAIGLLLAGLDIKNILGVVIESGKGGDRGDHHAHGVGVIVKAVKKFLDALVDEGVMGDVVDPLLQLRGAGKFAVQEKVSGFEIRAFFGEIFDGITAVAEDSGVAVNVGDPADAGRGVIVGRVVAHHAEIGGSDLDLAKVHGPDGIVGNGNLVGFAGAVVGDGERLTGRRGAF